MLKCGNCGGQAQPTHGIAFVFQEPPSARQGRNQSRRWEADAALCTPCAEGAFKHLKRYFGKRLFPEPVSP